MITYMCLSGVATKDLIIQDLNYKTPNVIKDLFTKDLMLQTDLKYKRPYDTKGLILQKAWITKDQSNTRPYPGLL